MEMEHGVAVPAGWQPERKRHASAHATMIVPKQPRDRRCEIFQDCTRQEKKRGLQRSGFRAVGRPLSQLLLAKRQQWHGQAWPFCGRWLVVGLLKCDDRNARLGGRFCSLDGRSS